MSHQRPLSTTGSQISSRGEFNFNIIPNPVVDMSSSQISGVLIPPPGSSVGGSEAGTMSPAPSYILIPTNFSAAAAAAAAAGGQDGAGGGAARNSRIMSMVRKKTTSKEIMLHCTFTFYVSNLEYTFRLFASFI